MKNNILIDLEIENIYLYDTITSLKWETMLNEYGEKLKKLQMILSSENGDLIEMQFSDVIDFKFEGNGMISGFYIKDMISSGFENCSRYYVREENDDIHFYCSAIKIRKIEGME